jgi:hypothetical protein
MLFVGTLIACFDAGPKMYVGGWLHLPAFPADIPARCAACAKRLRHHLRHVVAHTFAHRCPPEIAARNRHALWKLPSKNDVWHGENTYGGARAAHKANMTGRDAGQPQ